MSTEVGSEGAKLGVRVLTGMVLLGAALLVAKSAAAQSAAPSTTASAKAAFPDEPVTNAGPPAAPADAPPPPENVEPPPSAVAPAAVAPNEPAPPPPKPPRPPRSAPAQAEAAPKPPASRAPSGAVVALRVGYAIPKGKVTDASQDRLSDWFSGQASFLGELGWHLHPNLFVGGYAGIGVGGAGDVASNFCTGGDTTCVAVSVRFGLELQFHILPAGDADPWLGYGIGLEGASLSEKDSRHKQTDTLTGFEFGHFMGGVDVRVGRRFGLGPVVDFAVGRFTRVSTELDGAKAVDRSLDNRANHEWLTLGVRGVFYP